MTTHILTGIKPTGRPHLGNFVGMIQPTLKLIEEMAEEGEAFVFVANYHALNQDKDAAQIRQNTYELVATFLALGLDPEKVNFYKQSDVPEICELTSILSNVTPKGLMNRSHAYKAQRDRNEELGKELDDGVNMGLFNYPILMAADILMFDTNIVPVGKDQIQHVEFARDIAGSFNHIYGEVLTLPEFRVKEDAATVPGLDGRKMSKSYNNTIPVFEDPKAMRKAVMRIVTDSKLPAEPKDPDNTIYQLYKEVEKDSAKVKAMYDGFVNGGLGYGDAKKMLADSLDEMLEEPRKKFTELMSNKKYLDEVMEMGAQKVRKMAMKKISKVRRKVGLC